MINFVDLQINQGLPIPPATRPPSDDAPSVVKWAAQRNQNLAHPPADPLRTDLRRLLELVDSSPDTQAAVWATIRAHSPGIVSVKAQFDLPISQHVLNEFPPELRARLTSSYSLAHSRLPASATIVDFVRRAALLHNNGLVDSAIDLVVDSVDELLSDQRYALLDSILIETDVNGMPTEVALALLACTKVGSARLDARRIFLLRVIEGLRRRPDYDPRDFAGLE